MKTTSGTNSKRPLTAMQQAFLDALFSTAANGDARTAMDIAGYSKATQVSLCVESMKEEVVNLTHAYLASTGPLAAVAMRGVITDPTALGNRDRLAAAREILDRTGIVKTERVQVQTDAGGLFIMPPKKLDNNNDDTPQED